jgi:hypothetical protein
MSVEPVRVSVSSPDRKTIRTVGISTRAGGAGATYVNELLDVDAADPDNGETLVYDSVLGKYVVKPLEFIDGGSF